MITKCVDRLRVVGLSLMITLSLGFPASADLPIVWYAFPNQSPAATSADDAEVVLVYNRGGLSAVQNYVNDAVAANLRVILEVPSPLIGTPAIESFVNTFKNNPAVVGWYVYDEPDEQGVSVAQGQAAYDAIKALDPNRLVYAAIDGDALNAQDNYAGSHDVVIPFEYPFDPGNPEFEGLEDSFFGIVKGWKRQMRESAANAAENSKPWIPAIQTHGTTQGRPEGDSDHRLPTSNELRFMSFYSIVALGADGLSYWAHPYSELSVAQPGQPYPGSGVDWQVEVYDPMYDELKTMADALDAGAVTDAVSTNQEGDVYAEVYQDPNTGVHYLLIVNEEGSNRNTVISLTIDGIDFTQAIGLDGETVDITDNQFIYDFDNYMAKNFLLVPEPTTLGVLLLGAAMMGHRHSAKYFVKR